VRATPSAVIVDPQGRLPRAAVRGVLASEALIRVALDSEAGAVKPEPAEAARSV
jgi:hypothetical protein